MSHTKIAILGGSGFTGKRVLKIFQDQNSDIKVLVRNDESRKIIQAMGYSAIEGDAGSSESLCQLMEGCGSLICIMSLGFGHGQKIVNCAERMGVKRALFISTTGIFTCLSPASKNVRLEAEKIINNSTLEWTILRPTMIYGDIDDRNISRMIRAVNRYWILPLPGRGNALQRPILVDDLAKAIHKAFLSKETIKKAYNLSGQKALPFNAMLQLTAEKLKKKRLFIPVPFFLLIIATRILRLFLRKPPIKEEQILRMMEDKDFCPTQAQEDFDFTSHSFEEGVEMEIERMKEKKKL